MITIKKNTTILFQGDSVTDCYRDRTNDEHVGESYVKSIKEFLEPYNIKVVNRAIAGNKVNNLLDRFEKDFKDVKPDYIFILIGVNDTWHNYPNQKKGEIFEQEYDLLLTKINQEIKVPVILLEPFIVGYNQEITCMEDDLNDKINRIKELSKKYNTYYLSFKNEFNQKLNLENYLEYTIEGIHLLDKGYEIISEKIRENIVIK
ncbi:MAG: hypothetical protein IJX78_06265 [Bacilli bacterium]|nr:hypothetical protein [Bacilli bacterium]